MKTIYKKILLLLALIISLLLLSGQILNTVSEHVPPPGQLVDVGGFKLHIHCTGIKTDKPTIILEAGLGNAGGDFYWYQSELSKSEHVCSYDRAGRGWSELSNITANSENITTQLHTLLNKSNIKPPYVFAAHSAGALHTRLYLHKYPNEIVGIVFIDGSHPEQYAKELEIAPEVVGYEAMNVMLSTMETFGTVAKLGLFRIYNPFELPNDIFPPKITEGMQYYNGKPSSFEGFLYEARERLVNPLQTLTKQDLGDIPLTVVTTPFVPQSRVEGEAPSQTDKEITNSHKTLQHQTLLSSSISKMVIMDGADHMSLIFNKKHALQVIPHILDTVNLVSFSKE